MTQQPVTFQQVTVSEAASLLGISTQTVRRMIRRGQLEGERVHRPQGSAFVVNLPVDAPAGNTDATVTQHPTPNVSRSNATGQPAAEAMVSLIQTTIGTVLAPLVGQIDAQRQTIERQADRIADLEREAGGLRAELEAEKRAHSPGADNLTPSVPAPATDAPVPLLARWRAFAPWVLVVAILLLAGAGVVLLEWPR